MVQQELDALYLEQLEQIAGEIEGSELLAAFMETEEETEYNAMRDAFEPQIAKLHTEVCLNAPLQVITFEQILLNDYFQGLFLPRILGYSVLRGQLNKDYKYIRPQNHFRDILLAIVESSNFEFIKKRIGQTLQMGFALSSDIWITDIINNISNKRLRYFLQNNKIDDYRDLAKRTHFYNRYSNQFVKDNFLTANFPTTFGELKVEFPDLLHFLKYRVQKHLDNSNLNGEIKNLLTNEAFQGTTEQVQTLALWANFFQLEELDTQELTTLFNKVRQETKGFDETYLSFLLDLHNDDVLLNAAAELKASAIVDKSQSDQLSEYYTLADVVHEKGIADDESMNAVKEYYYRHEGLSHINECIRRMVFTYIKTLVNGYKESQYNEYFELAKVYTTYIHIFGNQQFSQDIKDISMVYVAKMIKKFTDKRARDYQDVKRFVSTIFVDLGFLKEKDTVEMFKTRRKRKEEK